MRAVATDVQPDYLGLVAETNRIRAVAPDSVYQAVVTMDLADSPFVQAVGLSSYPYLAGFAAPESLPLDYYSRIAQDAARPVLVVEGGWPSIAVGAVASSPAMQQRYIARQAALLDSARARPYSAPPSPP